MINSKKIKFITDTLNIFFPNPQIPLKYKNNYTMLIAVLLSAQTTDERVNKVTEKLFTVADSPEKMLKLSYENLLTIIRSCGLGPKKASNILALSRILIEKYKGKIPETFKELESLPGVGHKTAGVVLAQAFNKNTFPVDTHIIRLSNRWKLSDKKNANQVEKDLKNIFPEKDWKKLHLQMIYFGRNFCTAKKHEIKNCPICSKLATNAYRDSAQKEL